MEIKIPDADAMVMSLLAPAYDDVMGKVWACTSCGKQGKGITAMKNHVESHHLCGMLSFPCHYCSKINPTKAAAISHMKKIHSEIYHKNKQSRFQVSHPPPESSALQEENILS